MRNPEELVKKLTDLGVSVNVYDFRSAKGDIPKLGSSSKYGPISLYRGFLEIGTNLIQDHLYSKQILDWNNSALDTFGSERDVVFLVHGLSQHGGHFRNLRNTLIQGGFCPVVVSYDYRSPFLEYSQKVSEDINCVLGEKERGFAIGHSTGADILKYNLITGRNLKICGSLLAAGTFNGQIPDLVSRMLFCGADDYCNPQSPKSDGILDKLSLPVSDSFVVSFENDFFVHLNASFDRDGINFLVRNMGHISGSGINDLMNQGYLEMVNFLNK